MFKLDFEAATPSRLDAIQVLRAVAALLVVFSHLLRLEHEAWAGNPHKYWPAVTFGNFGVDAFFVISGFIMYRTAGRQFSVPGAATRFISRRIWRLAPAYWLFTALTLVCPFAFGWRRTGATGLALSLGFLPDVTSADLTPVLVVGWTLSFEMLFYVVFAACLALPRRIGLRILILAFPLFLAVAMVLSQSGLTAQRWWPVAEYWARLDTLLFVAGIALAMAQERFGRVVDRFEIGVFAAIGLLILGPSAVCLLQHGPAMRVEILLSAAAVAFCTLTSGGEGRAFRPLARLGDASYSLYLSHPIVIGALSVVWLRAIGPRAPVLFTVLALCASCAVAWLIYVWLEKPLTRAGQSLLGPVRPAVSPAECGGYAAE